MVGLNVTYVIVKIYFYLTMSIICSDTRPLTSFFQQGGILLGRMYAVERCRNCPNAVIDVDRTEKLFNEVFDSTGFDSRQAARLKTDRPMRHQVFRAAVAGCPNSCSQPQIKDFGVQGQVAPELGEGCNLCGACAGICPDHCIEVTQDGPAIDKENCLNCGICVRNCSTGALRPGGIGYRVLAGGKLGRRPRLAGVQLTLAGEKQMQECLQQMLELFLEKGLPGERPGQLLERLGLDVLPAPGN